MKYIILFIIPIIGCVVGFCQENITNLKVGDYQLELGVDNSIGKRKQHIKKSVENHFLEIGYFSHKKYENPGIRLRISKNLIGWSRYKIALVSGLTIRAGEKYGDDTYVIKSVPIQIKFSTELFKQEETRLALDLGGGLNLFKVKADYWISKTGPLFTMGLSYKITTKFLIKGGVELQYDKGSYFVFADPSQDIKDERIDYTEKREQIFVAVAITL